MAARAAAKVAQALFDRAPSKALYIDKYRNDPFFTKTVNTVFCSTKSYLFLGLPHGGGGVRRGRPAIAKLPKERVLDAFYDIGEVLGVYIVCLWQLERDLERRKVRVETEDGRHFRHLRERASKYGGPNPYGDLKPLDDINDDEYTFLEEYPAEIHNLQVQIKLAVDRILDPNAPERNDYDEYGFQWELARSDGSIPFEDCYPKTRWREVAGASRLRT